MLIRRLFWFIALLVPVFGWSQSADRFHVMLQSAPSQQPELAASKMTLFFSELQAKRAKLKSDEAFLRHAFRESHKTFFHNYKAYSQFPEIFDSGNYDCLSATSFFSIVLDRFQFDYQIFETNYHIFLVVEVNQKQILFESTDRENGFVTDDQSIKERMEEYRENKLQTIATTDEYYYQYNLDLFRQVMPEQLTGLLYFNQSVDAFNNNELQDCALKLMKAIKIYNSPRISEFVAILISKVAISQLEEEEKLSLIRPFASFIKIKSPIVASR